MRHARFSGLTLVEVIVILSVILLAIGLFLPWLGSQRRKSRSMQTGTQVRGIHTGLVLYAQGNNGYYPGMAKDGVTVDPAVGLTTQGRIQKLIDDGYFTLKYARSPSENQTGTTSYALLQVNTDPDHENLLTKAGRNIEWSDTANTQAPVISDRAINNGVDFDAIKSIHTSPSPGQTDWRGRVGWNDNHATFESTITLTTVYGKTPHNLDHLFINQTGDAHSGSDAYMVYDGTNGL